MIKTIIVDDEEDARGTLRAFLRMYCPSVELIDEASGVQDGYRKIMAGEPDLVLLDIQMEDGTGFDLLEKVRNPKFQVIFCTAFDEFAIKAFKYSAIDYLLKPIDPDELIESVSKVKNSQESGEQRIDNLLEFKKSGKSDRITLSSQEGFTVVKLENIIRLESDSNYTNFFLTTGERILVPKSMKEFEGILPDEQFFRTHQSHIVNMEHVKKYMKEDGGYILMDDGSEVLVARRRKEEFLSFLTGQ
ncbi:MAG: LytTR family DNA-binding domain-containing protein [Flavobacteriales bacterium]|uniref:LytR/AlgR family response regulator transcription factor n=1 Tax=Sanyastnella coralliicola TaxID=3069118 RepID=UPI0027B93A2B|nr:LytTR family DNA-binding domain-containing protein [Longitalea sp. SCSIO 12813]MCH2199509.1 LytTR family DNA-binding domain-containing protein [Flavobacteriales bacterium]